MIKLWNKAPLTIAPLSPYLPPSPSCVTYRSTRDSPGSADVAVIQFGAAGARVGVMCS